MGLAPHTSAGFNKSEQLLRKLGHSTLVQAESHCSGSSDLGCRSLGGPLQCSRCVNDPNKPRITHYRAGATHVQGTCSGDSTAAKAPSTANHIPNPGAEEIKCSI